jgi:hypothetical protein
MTGKAMTLLGRSVLLGLTLALGAFVLDRWGAGRWWILGAMVVFGLVCNYTPWVGVRWLDHLVHLVRALCWRHDEGRYHAFSGLGIRLDDDGRHVWMLAEDLQRLTRSSEPLDVIAARHSARWRRDDRGDLWLRADAVAEQLARARDALDPRTVRLRRYIERDILFPAEQRRRRRSAS